MVGRSSSRNEPCPCGSGRKYKRCCLADEERIAREARLDDAVGRRIQRWASEAFASDVGAALEEFVDGGERVMNDADIQIFATWFHNDRELARGGTPAQRYAARSDLPEDERLTAGRIATARLGLYRVLAVEPGRTLTLEDLVDDRRVEASSPHVSREAIRWDIALCRLMDGDPPSLWGPARFFEPCEEPELRAELARLQTAPSGARALALMRYIPPSRRAEPSFYTLEGDPVVFATAVWEVRDHASAAATMRRLGGLVAGEPLEIDITAQRSALVRQRPPLPLGAIVLESSQLGDVDRISIASLRLDGGELRAETMSEERLEQTLEIVAADFGELVELRDYDVTSLDDARAEDPSTGPAPAPDDVATLRVLGDLANERMRRWLDEPHQSLAGRTPREAALGPDRDEVVRLLHQLENGAERARRRGQPPIDVAGLRDELGLGDELAA